MFFSCKLVTHSCCLLLNEFFQGFFPPCCCPVFHLLAHCNVSWALKAQRVIFTTPQCLFLTYKKSNKHTTHGKMFSAVWGHWCNYNELFPGGPWVLRQVGLHFLLFYELWVFSRTLAQAVQPARRRKQQHGMTLWRGRPSGRLTFHWHDITGLLHISACAALIIQCDLTKIVHYFDCVGTHYHQLHIPLWSQIIPECIWDMKSCL